MKGILFLITGILCDYLLSERKKEKKKDPYREYLIRKLKEQEKK